jgi:hypothetical protein
VSVTDGVRYRAHQGSWIAHGYDGSSVIPSFGTYQPSAATTGYNGDYAATKYATLTPQSGDITISVAGTTLTGLDISGKVRVQAANVTISSCRIRGNNTQSTNAGLIDCTSAAASNVLIQDCLIVPDTPSVWWTGILGHDYTVRRSEVHNSVDGFGGYNTTNSNGPANVYVYGNYVHDLFYSGPDPNHSDNRTHNDCIQIQGNSLYRIVGNNFIATANPAIGTASGGGSYGDPYYISSTGLYSVTGQCVAITPAVGAITDLVIDSNWFAYGAQSITAILGSYAASNLGSITNNHFDSRTNYVINKSSSNGQVPDQATNRAVLIYNNDTVANFPQINTSGTDAVTSFLDTVCGNVDYDGSPVRVFRLVN